MFSKVRAIFISVFNWSVPNALLLLNNRIKLTGKQPYCAQLTKVTGKGKIEIGKNCTLRQGVTVGNRHAGGPVPVLGDNVELGAYAQILGGVKIGNHCHIGAMSVVLHDMPDGSTAVGVPARLITSTRTERTTADRVHSTH